MSNNYTGYCSVVATDLTEEEIAWLIRYQDLLPTWQDRHGGYGCLEIDGNALFANSDYGEDVEEAVRQAQVFYDRWRPTKVGEINFAFWCSRQRLDEFGGGVVVFNKDEAVWAPFWPTVAAEKQRLKEMVSVPISEN